ncbi:vacuolar protein sorting-associated protein 37B isoform X1 [Phyllopteryx taeniolatus]|uniref:vacuolar protein sorting-associated protein 37B isoform X1 n=1 Tax=Phyllopteryx taeniolatus TaxID=161469 RepID=UPI002AD3B2F5|nr:vacuolar protein sorting-associated protein 37B isoform X1 [Phyllopteryx taeniolatus]
MELTACPDGYRALSTGELRELLQSDDKMEQIIRLNEKFQELQVDREMMLASNRSVAEDSLARQPRLNNGRLQLAEKYRELSNLATMCWEKQSQLGTRVQKHSLQSAQNLLQEEMARAEENSESVDVVFTGAAGQVHGGEREAGGLLGLLPELQEDLPHQASAGGEDAGLEQKAHQQSRRRRRGRDWQNPRGGESGFRAPPGPPAAQRLPGAGPPPGLPGTLRPHAGHPVAALPRFPLGLSPGPPGQDSPARTPPTGTRPRAQRSPPPGGTQGDRTAARGLAGQRAAGTIAAALQAQPPTAPTALPIGRERKVGGAKLLRAVFQENGLDDRRHTICPKMAGCFHLVAYLI